MDLADPVSSGKYSGTLVFTAPVAEPTVVSYSVPLVGCTIVAIATIVTLCSSARRDVVACGGGFLTPDGAYDSVCDIVRPMTGIRYQLFPVSRGRWVCLHAQ